MGITGKGAGKGKSGSLKGGKGGGKGGGCGFKTELCIFHEQGVCLKKLCTFAHGQEELRPSGVGGVEKKSAFARTGGDMIWLKAMKDRPGKDGEEFAAKWKAWCADHGVQNMEKSQWTETIAEFRSSYESGQGSSGSSRATPQAATPAKEPASGVADAMPWLGHAALAVRQLLEKALDADALRKMDAEESAIRGKEALKAPIAQKAYDMAGGVLEHVELSALQLWCVGAPCLTAAFHLVDLGSIAKGCESLEAAQTVAALCWELQVAASAASQASPSEKAQRALVDFLFLLGTSTFALRVGSAGGKEAD